MKMTLWIAIACLLPLAAAPASAGSAEERDRRIEELTDKVRALTEELRELRTEPVEESPPGELLERVRILEEKTAAAGRLDLGGYGESHLNFGEGSTGDFADHHRFVLYVGYTFADWIRFYSETEIEHGFVADGAGGELSIEQFTVDFLLSDAANLRFGRLLTPIGVTNRKHEPPSFNGVERPLFDRVIVPTTWSSDGLGLFGSLAETLSYEICLVAGLDGSGFSALSGIRGGRIKERPGLSHPGVTGRIDFFPFAEAEVTGGQALRVGLSGYYAGIDNGNKAANPGVGDSLGIVSADFEYSISSFDFRGAAAWELVDGAREIGGGVASAIFGWYVEGAVHVLPESMRTGRLRAGDLVLFLRYEDVDTQFRMPAGIGADDRGDRTLLTVGATLFLRPSLVVKADFQIPSDGTSDSLDRLVNLGIGWQF